MGLEPFLHFGYFIVLASVLLMIWASYANAAACSFDASCSCSSGAPQLGQVLCKDAPVNLPTLNASKLFTLSLVNNGLDNLQANLFQGTGLYKLEISRNPVYSLHEEALSGLERSLWELHVTHCRLSNVPGNALRHLNKLKTLNLTGNEIVELSSEELRGVSASLQTLVLADNALTMLPAGVFGSMQQLELLDLKGNSLATLNPATFTPPPPRLARINLADNLFENLPYKELSGIRALRSLDLSYNQITRLGGGPPGGRMILDSLYLDHNQITQLGTTAMSHFEIVNRTSFKANPIDDIEPNAFRGCRITELILAECHLTEINPEAFNDLENSLQVLDLSGNNISAFPSDFLRKYGWLRSLQLDYNYLLDLRLSEETKDNGDQLFLLHLDLAGRTNNPINLRNFPRLGHLQSLSLSRPQSSTLNSDDLSQFSVELETLRVVDGGLSSLGPQLFRHTRGIKTLDFTDNRIDSLDSKTFSELGHSLENLILSHSLSGGVSSLPSGLLRPLTALEVLKINHNSLTVFPPDVARLSNLRILHAHDNGIENINNNVFQENVHTKLEEIDLSFNKIPRLKVDTFSDLRRLKIIYLSDNVISQMDRGTFVNLMELMELRLRGNRLINLPLETFQNLPKLNLLDLAFNSLRDFDFSCLEQVGMLSELTVNISHNSLNSPTVNTSIHRKDIVYTNIKVLDMSHNNMSHMGAGYLLPVQYSLTHLYMSHNAFVNASRDCLPEMPHLQLLDFSHNKLIDIEFDTLRGVRNLQVVSFAHNMLQDLPSRLFASLNSLRRIDLSHNKFTSLMDAIIGTPSIVRMDLSHNSLTRAPLTIFSPSAASCLMELDISYNKIASLPSAESFGRFSNLRSLDISGNRLTEVGNSFSLLPCLSSLRLAHNFLHIGGKDFAGLEDTLLHLDLTNISVSYVPSLPLPSLLSLRMPHNTLAYLPPDMATNLTSLRHMDLSYNSLLAVPSFPQLKSLSLANNQITILSNSTFRNYHMLMELNIQHLPLQEFDIEALEDLSVLRTLHISNYKQIPNFNIPQWIEKNRSLRTLHLEVNEAQTLGSEMKGTLPFKVRHMVLSGREMRSVPDHILQGIKHPSLRLTVFNTSVEGISAGVFTASPHLRNISLHLYNNTLKSVANPSNTGAVNTPRKVFLTDLSLQGNQWTCDCGLGWVETWQRKRRQFWHDDVTIEDSRETKCRNKQNKPLLNVLKADLECGWSHSTTLIAPSAVVLSIFASFVAFY